MAVDEAGASRDRVHHPDIALTIYEAAGVKSPVATHGRSLLRVLQRPSVSWRRYLAAEFHFHGAGLVLPAPCDPRLPLQADPQPPGWVLATTGIDGDRAFPLSRDARYDGTPARRAFDTFALTRPSSSCTNPTDRSLRTGQRRPHRRAGRSPRAHYEKRRCWRGAKRPPIRSWKRGRRRSTRSIARRPFRGSVTPTWDNDDGDPPDGQSPGLQLVCGPGGRVRLSRRAACRRTTGGSAQSGLYGKCHRKTWGYRPPLGLPVAGKGEKVR